MNFDLPADDLKIPQSMLGKLKSDWEINMASNHMALKPGT